MIKTRLFFFLPIVFLLSSCVWQSENRPSVIVIAVDSFGFNNLDCSEQKDSKDPGFSFFCNESVRYTHAFTSSALSQPAMTSLLTGLYPHEHQVYGNGENFLSSKFVTVAEEAVKRGMRTAFFTGGPPILRKSGLVQGFEIWDQHFKPRFNQLYKPVSEVFSSFDFWLNFYVKDSPFFASIFLADLQFPDSQTKNSLGETRVRNRQSQIAEIGENLEQLKKSLESKNRWNNTYVILVGLNGEDNEFRSNEIKPINLHSENLHVALLIKPVSKKRDLSMNWAVDKNVSIVDVGASLFEMVGANIPTFSGRTLEVDSLMQSLTVPEPNWSNERLLLYESGWSSWRSGGEKFLGARKGHYNIILGRPTRIYNTLIDKDELLSMSNADPLWGDLFQEVNNLYLSVGNASYGTIDQMQLEKINIAKKLWQKDYDPRSLEKEIDEILVNYPWDQQLISWYAQKAFEYKNWDLLEKLAKFVDNKPWLYLVSKIKGRAVKINLNGCSKFILRSKKYIRPSKKQCDNETFIAALDWVKEKDQQKKANYLEIFWRKYSKDLIYERIAQQNYINYLTWDVDPKKPRGPSVVDIFMALPENKSYSSIVEKRISRFLK